MKEIKNVTIPAPLTGDGRLCKEGSGTLHLTGTNTYARGTQIESGILPLPSKPLFSAAGIVLGCGGTLDLSAPVRKSRTRAKTLRTD